MQSKQSKKSNKIKIKNVKVLVFFLLVVTALLGAYLSTTRTFDFLSSARYSYRIVGGTQKNPHVDGNFYYDHRIYTDKDQSPLPGYGNGLYYSKGVMDRVWRYRKTKENYANCEECVGFMALLRDGDKRRKVCVKRDDHDRIEGPFYVIDVVADVDKAHVFAKGWAFEVDWETSQKWGGGNVKGSVVECPLDHIPYIEGGPSRSFQRSELLVPNLITDDQLFLNWSAGQAVTQRRIEVETIPGLKDIYVGSIDRNSRVIQLPSFLDGTNGSIFVTLYSFDQVTKIWVADGPYEVRYEFR